jgi:lysophospholipid acyltransferase (LPLAT)-like uncharacterized protein
MIKKALNSSLVQTILSAIAAFYIWFIWVTTRWTFLNENVPQDLVLKNQGFITCFWHNRLFMLGPSWKRLHNHFYMLISAHKDGKIISKTVAYFGIQMITGSTNKSGNKALKEMVLKLKNNGVVGITPDGPRGPREQVTIGLIQTAYLSQKPIVPITYSCKKGKTFPSWDRFFLPHPFNKGSIVWGDPIDPPKSKEDFEEKRIEVERALKQIQAHAEKVL